MARFTTIAEVIASYADRFMPEAAAGVEGVVQLSLTGDGAAEYQLLIGDGQLRILEGVHETPTVTVTTSAEDWLKVNNREEDPMGLVMRGRIKVKGSLPMAAKFQSLFRRGDMY